MKLTSLVGPPPPHWSCVDAPSDYCRGVVSVVVFLVDAPSDYCRGVVSV